MKEVFIHSFYHSKIHSFNMKVTLKRLNKDVLFEGANADGNTIQLDGSPEIGGEGKGMRPTESLLVSIAACSSIDVVLILKKMKQQIDDYKVEVEADRVSDGESSKYSTIHLHFILKGDIKEKKLEQAIQMSLDKYCSVSKILAHSAKITSSFTLNEA